MVQLQILAGVDAGILWRIERFPCVIGRSCKASVRLEEPGVWDEHVEIGVNAAHGVTLTVLPGALATVNGYPVEQVLLRNGDLIEFGAVRLHFMLAPSRQRSFRARETLTWIGFGLLSAAQIVLVYILTL